MKSGLLSMKPVNSNMCRGANKVVIGTEVFSCINYRIMSSWIAILKFRAVNKVLWGRNYETMGDDMFLSFNKILGLSQDFMTGHTEY